MLLEDTKFLCTQCKKVFRGPFIEYMATAYAQPCRCPKCNSIRTLPLAQMYLYFAYKGIWQKIEEESNK